VNCIMCKSKLDKSRVNHIVDKMGRIVIIKNVPANVCGQCGEYYVDNDTGNEIGRNNPRASKLIRLRFWW